MKLIKDDFNKMIKVQKNLKRFIYNNVIYKYQQFI